MYAELSLVGHEKTTDILIVHREAGDCQLIKQIMNKYKIHE